MADETEKKMAAKYINTLKKKVNDLTIDLQVKRDVTHSINSHAGILKVEDLLPISALEDMAAVIHLGKEENWDGKLVSYLDEEELEMARVSARVWSKLMVKSNSVEEVDSNSFETDGLKARKGKEIESDRAKKLDETDVNKLKPEMIALSADLKVLESCNFRIQACCDSLISEDVLPVSEFREIETAVFLAQKGWKGKVKLLQEGTALKASKNIANKSRLKLLK